MQYHVPLKGTISCEHCHTPLEHWGMNGIDCNRDEAHARLAREAAKSFGETWETPDGIMRTPKKYFPYMMQKAADWLAARVRGIMFCPYCGKAVEQPGVCPTLDNIHPLPRINYNAVNLNVIERWSRELVREVPLDYHEFTHTAFKQHEVAIVPYSKF